MYRVESTSRIDHDNETTYTDIATSNFATYKPRKDRCDTCTAYNAGNVDENEYQEHIKKKKRSHGRKEKRE